MIAHLLILQLLAAWSVLGVPTGMTSHGQIDDPCYYSSDCTVENTDCIRGRCNCIENYFIGFSWLNNTCIEFASKLYESCALDALQCVFLNKTYCNNGKCVCEDGFIEKDGECVIDSNALPKVASDSGAKNSECSSEECQCADDHVYDMGKCVNYATEIDEPCETDKKCSRIPDAWCEGNKVCKCTWEHDEANNKCLSFDKYLEKYSQKTN